MSEPSIEGGCQCRTVRYRLIGPPVMAAFCHCSLCRRAHAAPVVAWAMYNERPVEFLAGPPAVYESSPGCRRGFCSRCGTQLSFAAEYLPGLIDIAIVSLDEPHRVPPAFHYWESERCLRLRLGDRLPRHPEFPPMA